MGVSNWQFADQFGKLYDRAQRYGIEHQDVMNDELPLIHWEGNTEYLDWLCDSTKEPPLDVANIQRSKPHEQFLCWLMLPGDFSGKKWYFGRVFTTRLSLTDEIKVLMDFASDAGSYLRRDQLFFNYLSPCLEHHTKLAARFPTLQDDRNASYWFALLFARPELGNPLKFPYEKTIAKDTIAEATIANPFKLAVDVIHRWRLNAPTPYPADGHVAPPYQWPTPTPVAATTPDGEPDQLAITANEWWPDDGWHFREGEAAFRGVAFKIQGVPRRLLKKLAEAGKPVSDVALLAEIDPKGDAGQESLRTQLSRTRRILRRAFRMPPKSDPLPNVERGRDAAWKLDEKVFPSVSEMSRSLNGR